MIVALCAVVIVVCLCLHEYRRRQVEQFSPAYYRNNRIFYPVLIVAALVLMMAIPQI